MKESSILKKMDLSGNNCFICGNSSEITQEHVIPKWIQNKYDLWNQTLELINNTTITYKHLKIPCCRECNNKHLSNIENLIKNAASEGVSKLTEINKISLFLWLSKIYYGMQFKDLLLPRDRKSRDSTSILPKEALEKYRTLHIFMQGFYNKNDYVNFFPASIFIMRVYDDDKYDKYDYIDDIRTGTMMIKLGEIGIIATLLDSGSVQKKLFSDYELVKNEVLHPIQFMEFAANAFYVASLIKNTNAFIGISDISSENYDFIKVSNTKFDDYSVKSHAAYKYAYWNRRGFKTNLSITESGYITTFIRKEDGTFKDMVGCVCK